MNRRPIFLAWYLSLPAAVVSVPCLAERDAVLVPVKGYYHDRLRTPRLKYTVDDVTELAKMLKGDGYQVALLTGDAGAADSRRLPTREKTDHLMLQVVSLAQPDDTLLLASARHGKPFAGSADACFCPNGGTLFADETATLVSISGVYGELPKSIAGVIIIFVNVCRSDPDSGRGCGIDADSSPPPPRGVAARFRYSGGQLAFERDQLKHDVFAYGSPEGFCGKAANADGNVTFDGLVSYVWGHVPGEVKPGGDCRRVRDRLPVEAEWKSWELIREKRCRLFSKLEYFVSQRQRRKRV